MGGRRKSKWVLWTEHVDPNTGTPLPWKKNKTGDLQCGKLRILWLEERWATGHYLVLYKDSEIAYFVEEYGSISYPHYRCRNIDDVVAWAEAALPYIKRSKKIKAQNVIAFRGKFGMGLEPWSWDESERTMCVADHEAPHEGCVCGHRGYFSPWEAWDDAKLWIPAVSIIRPAGKTVVENGRLRTEKHSIVATFVHVSWTDYAPKWVYRSPNPPLAAWKVANWILKEEEHGRAGHNR